MAAEACMGHAEENRRDTGKQARNGANDHRERGAAEEDAPGRASRSGYSGAASPSRGAPTSSGMLSAWVTTTALRASAVASSTINQNKQPELGHRTREGGQEGSPARWRQTEYSTQPLANSGERAGQRTPSQPRNPRSIKESKPALKHHHKGPSTTPLLGHDLDTALTGITSRCYDPARVAPRIRAAPRMSHD